MVRETALPLETTLHMARSLQLTWGSKLTAFQSQNFSWWTILCTAVAIGDKCKILLWQNILLYPPSPYFKSCYFPVSLSIQCSSITFSTPSVSLCLLQVVCCLQHPRSTQWASLLVSVLQDPLFGSSVVLHKKLWLRHTPSKKKKTLVRTFIL